MYTLHLSKINLGHIPQDGRNMNEDDDEDDDDGDDDCGDDDCGDDDCDDDDDDVDDDDEDDDNDDDDEDNDDDYGDDYDDVGDDVGDDDENDDDDDDADCNKRWLREWLVNWKSISSILTRLRYYRGWVIEKEIERNRERETSAFKHVHGNYDIYNCNYDPTRAAVANVWPASWQACCNCKNYNRKHGHVAVDSSSTDDE